MAIIEEALLNGGVRYNGGQLAPIGSFWNPRTNCIVQQASDGVLPACGTFIQITTSGSTGRTRADPLVYPHPLRYADHAEFGCHSLIPGTTIEALVAGFEEARRAGGNFCLATHYWEVSDAMKDVMRRFLDYAAGHAGVRFVAAEELFA